MKRSKIPTPEIPTTVKNPHLVEKRREQIVRAAIKVFAKKGFHKATMKDLAEEAGISYGNLYYYVGTKEDIFFLIYEFIAKLTNASLIKSTEDVRDPLEKLYRMIHTEFNLMYQWADAILLLYQEAHVMKPPFLRKMLEAESDRIRRFESALQEGIKSGQLGDFNTSIASNLLKAMLEAWVAKRWNLRGRVTSVEMEESLLDLVFHGLLREKSSVSRGRHKLNVLDGKSALISHGGTFLGNALSTFLFSKGAKVAVYEGVPRQDIKPSISDRESLEQVKVYSAKDCGQMTTNLLKRIISELGRIDIFIQDLGADYVDIAPIHRDRALASQELDANLRLAQLTTSNLEEQLDSWHDGRIVFLAPSAWDCYTDPLHYQMLKAGTVSLTQTLAKRLSPLNINVNCVVPGFISGSKPLYLEKEESHELLDHIPMGCLGEIADVMEAAYFFISDVSKYITGQVLEVAGGKSLSWPMEAFT